MDWEWTGSDFYLHEQETCGHSKSEEEIKKYTLKEGLNEVQRSKKLLKYGESVQKIAIYRNLPTLVKNKQTEEKLLSLVVRQLDSEDSSVQVEAGNTFLKMLEQKSCDSFENITFLKDIFSLNLNMLHVQNIQVVDSWVLLLQKLLCLIPFGSIQKTLETEIFDLSEIATSNISKYAAMKILATSIQHMKNNLSEHIVQLINLFSQVSNSEIRRCVISEVWPQLFPLLQTTSLDGEWLQMIVDVINDVSISKETRQDAINTLAETSKYFSGSSNEKIILPLISNLIQVPQQDHDIIHTLSKKIGYFALQFRDVPHEVIFNFIFNSLENKQEDIRINSFFNFPCFLEVYSPKYRERLIKIYIQVLLKDPDSRVRIQVIKSFAEVVKQEGQEQFREQFFPTVQAILNETDKNEVRMEMIQVLDKIFPLVYQDDKFEILTELITILNDIVVSPCSLLTEEVLLLLDRQFQRYNSRECNKSKGFQTFIKSEICDKYGNILLRCASEGNFQIKLKGIKNLVTLMQVNKYNQPTLFAQVAIKLFRGISYHQRLAYLYLVEEVMDRLGREAFKKYKLLECMQFSFDKVKNVRRKLSKITTKIRKMINDLNDIDYFDEFFIHLLSDRDRETLKIAQESCSYISTQQFEKEQKELDLLEAQQKQHNSLMTNSFLQEEKKSDIVTRKDSLYYLGEGADLSQKGKQNYRSFDSIEKAYYKNGRTVAPNIPIQKRNFNVKKIPWKPQQKSLSQPSAPESQSSQIVEPKPSQQLNTSIQAQPPQSHFLSIPVSKPRRNSSTTAERPPRTIQSAKFNQNGGRTQQNQQENLQPSLQQQKSSSILKHANYLAPLSSGQTAFQQEYQELPISKPSSHRNSFISSGNNSQQGKRDRSNNSLNKQNHLKPLYVPPQLKNKMANQLSPNSYPSIVVSKEEQVYHNIDNLLLDQSGSNLHKDKHKFIITSEPSISSPQLEDKKYVQSERRIIIDTSNQHQSMYRIKKTAPANGALSPSLGLPPRFFPKKAI